VALIVVFAAVLRVYGISSLGFWTDELGALSCANGWGLRFAAPPMDRIEGPIPICTRWVDARAIPAVFTGLARDESHPPVYFVLLRWWEELFGDSEAGVRSLNVVFSLAAIGLLFMLASETIGPTAALWACLLMAVASPQITFAQEARNYMPGMTLSLAAGLAWVHLKHRPTIARCAILAFAVLVMMLTHYFAAGVGIALAIQTLVSTRGRARRFTVIAALVAVAIFAILWGRQLIEQLPNFKLNYAWLVDSGPGRVWRWMFHLGKVPAELVATGLGPWAEVSGLVFLWLPIAYVRRPELRLWILWLACTVGLVAGLDLARSTTQLTLPRYLLFATPAAYVLLAAAVRGRWHWLLPAIGVATALLSLPAAYVPPWKIDLRTPVQVVNHLRGPEDGLVISGPDAVFDGVTFAAFQHYSPTMPAACVILTKPADSATLARLRQCPHVWVIWMWPGRSIDKFLPGFKAGDQNHLPEFGDVVEGVFAMKS
jgi:uncharacterized membrane protein